MKGSISLTIIMAKNQGALSIFNHGMKGIWERTLRYTSRKRDSEIGIKKIKAI